jgi:hypothetical protein
MAGHARGPGRPVTSPQEGQNVTLGLRVDPELKEKLAAAALRNNRTLSREAELRLKASFAEEEVLRPAPGKAASRQLSGLLLLLGHVMASAGFTNRLLSTDHRDGSGNWFADPFAYEQAIQAANEVLGAYRPKGDPNRLASGKPVIGWANNGRAFASSVIEDLAQNQGHGAELAHVFERLGAPRNELDWEKEAGDAR